MSIANKMILSRYSQLLYQCIEDHWNFCIENINESNMDELCRLYENDIKNLPYVIKHRGVNDIKDLFKDYIGELNSNSGFLNLFNKIIEIHTQNHQVNEQVNA